MDSLLVLKVGNGSRTSGLARVLRGSLVAATVALLAFTPRAAFAQSDDEDDPGEIDANHSPTAAAPAVPNTEPKPEAKPEVKKENAPPAAQPAEPDIAPGSGPDFAVDNFSEQKNGYVPHAGTATVDWHGGIELDTGYAKYTFDSPTYDPERVYDMRGRFVLGPTLTHEFGGHYFIRARGEAVAWLRDAVGQYQVNVDDVWAQIGDKGLWDLKVGRFFSWRVYHKGLGVDLYTLEDTGALSENDYENPGAFGPHTYEVNNIYYRERPGRFAFHLYPTDFLGIEALGLYGRESLSSNTGGRGAVIAHWPFLRVSGAAEYRHSNPAIEALGDPDPNTGIRPSCDKCGVTNTYGYGGGIELTLKPVEISLNAAQEHVTTYAVKDGSLDPRSSNKTTTIGGYAEVDVGSLAMQRTLVVGGGWNRTEVNAQSTDYAQHIQMQGYAAYPLGFNDAMIKLVVSRATLENLISQGNNTFAEKNSVMNSVRFRFSMGF